MVYSNHRQTPTGVRVLADQSSEQLGFSLVGMEASAPPVSSHAVRLELTAILDAAGAAKDSAPWDIETHRHYKATFDAKTKVLPPDEAVFLRKWFAMEAKRIDELLAA